MALLQLIPLAQRVAGNQCVAHADAQNGTDQGVRAGSRNTEVPGTQVPQNGGGQQGKHHHHALGRVDVQQQVGGDQVNNGVSHGQTAKEHPQEVEQTGQHHGGLRFHGLGVDNGCYRVGGIVKTVDEFKSQDKGHRENQGDCQRSVEPREEFQHDDVQCVIRKAGFLGFEDDTSRVCNNLF